MIIRVVDVRIGMVVSEARDHQDALSLIDFVVGDDGTVYGLGGSGTGLQGLRLELGGSSFEPIVDEFPDGFVPWRGTTLLESERVGWSGVFDAEATQPTYGLVTTDLSDGTVRSYPLDGVTGGLVDEHDLGDFMLEEFVLPGVAWDMERRRALVVHADERVVSVVDLPTGDVTMHRWAPQTSWIERLATWGMSRVLADQPSLETIRQARLSPDGTLLYVGTSTGEFETWEDGSWAVTRRPRGVEVISTESWEQTASWGIPASNLNLSSDGNYLVATGITNTDTGLTGEFGPGGVFVIDTITMDLIGKIGGDRTENPAIEFSEDGSLAYVMSPSGTGEVQMIDLANAEVVQTIQRPPELTVLDQGRLIVTQVP